RHLEIAEHQLDARAAQLADADLYLPAIAADNVGDHGQTNPLPLCQRIEPGAPLQHELRVRCRDAGAVVLNHDTQAAAWLLAYRGGHLQFTLAVLVGIVDDIAQHLHQIPFSSHEENGRINGQ